MPSAIMNFLKGNGPKLTEKLQLSEGGGVSEGGVNYCNRYHVTVCIPFSVTPESIRGRMIPPQSPKHTITTSSTFTIFTTTTTKTLRVATSAHIKIA